VKFIYVFNEQVQEEFIKKGLIVLGETTINGIKAKIFQNSKTVFLNQYEKNEVLLSNKLVF
jgi:hypothetical protein